VTEVEREMDERGRVVVTGMRRGRRKGTSGMNHGRATQTTSVTMDHRGITMGHEETTVVHKGSHMTIKGTTPSTKVTILSSKGATKRVGTTALGDLHTSVETATGRSGGPLGEERGGGGTAGAGEVKQMI
jgi:hypothetical protein